MSDNVTSSKICYMFFNKSILLWSRAFEKSNLIESTEKGRNGKQFSRGYLGGIILFNKATGSSLMPAASC